MKCSECAKNDNCRDLAVPMRDGGDVFYETVKHLCFVCFGAQIRLAAIRESKYAIPAPCKVQIRVPAIVGGNGAWTTFQLASEGVNDVVKHDEFNQRIGWMQQDCVEQTMPLPRIVYLQAWVELPIEAEVEAEEVQS